jgi:hypothetical protein
VEYFSRRSFLLGGASVFALGLPDAEAALRLHGSGVSGVQTAGKVQTGLTSMFANIDYPFIDICRMAGSTWQAFLSPTVDPYQYLNADGYPNAMPAGAFEWRMVNLAGQLLDPSDGFGGRWVLDWTGGPATLDAVFTGANVSQSVFSSTITGTAGRIVFNVTSTSLSPGAALLMQINITAVTGQITKVRLFPAALETLLATQQWHPDFISFYKVWGRTRYMDWAQTNGNTQILWSSKTTTTQFSQVGFNIQSYCGQASKTSKNSFTTLNAPPGNPSSWTNGQIVETFMPLSSAPTYVDVQSMTPGTTTVINATAHGMSTGDTVQFANGSFPSGTGQTTDAATHLCSGSPVFTITVINANSFSLNGINSSAWTATSGGGQVFWTFQVASGLLPSKPVSGFDGSSIFLIGFGSFIANTDIVCQFVYDADFDRLMYCHAPDGLGTGVPTGCNIELLVDLANTIYAANGNQALQQPWFCIPNMADDTYVTNWATYIRDNLNPAITFCVEYSNEVWNTAAGFIQTSWHAAKGAIQWSTPSSLETEYQYYGYRFRSRMAIIESVFSGQMNRVNRVFGNHVTDVTSLQVVIDRHQCPLGGFTSGDYPINHADSLCTANYYNMNQSNTLDATQVHDLVYGVNTTLLTTIDNHFRTDASGSGSLSYLQGQWTQWATFCNGYTSNISGKKIQPTNYEGGFNAYPLYSQSGTPYSPPITITGGTYDSSTGHLKITTTPALLGMANGQSITLSGFTGTGSVSSLNGTYGIANNLISSDDPTTGTLWFIATSGLGSITITGGAAINITADTLTAMYMYQDSATYAQFLTDASNANVASGYNYPSQFCVVSGGRNQASPFELIQPNRFAPATLAYTAFRTLNGR